MTESRKALARWLLAGGVLGFWVVQLTLLVVAEMPLLDSVLLSVLLVVVPMFSLAQLPLIEDAVIRRMPAYWSSIVTLWILGTACWFVGTRIDGPAGVGLTSIRPGAFVMWTTVLTTLGLVIILLFRRLAIAWNAHDSELLRELLPRTPQEKGVFALLSLAAGAGEELAYRGYAILVLVPAIGTGGAVALTSITFGIVHGYQGLLGMARTGLMGAVLAWGFLAGGSLWPAIVAHTCIDLVAGIAIGERLLSPGGPEGVEDRPSLPPLES